MVAVLLSDVTSERREMLLLIGRLSFDFFGKYVFARLATFGGKFECSFVFGLLKKNMFKWKSRLDFHLGGDEVFPFSFLPHIGLLTSYELIKT